MKRSNAAKFALSVFFESYNDFDVYIEDTAPGYDKIFASLLSRDMSRNIALERVFPIGQRREVIKAANERLATPSPRNAVFIIDGDLYLLCGEKESIPANVVTLPRYCIENFLIEENALLDVMDEETHLFSLDRLRTLFDYSGWLGRSRPMLLELFKSFAVSHFLASGIPTVSMGYGSICADGTGEIDPEKVNEIVESLYAQLADRYGAPEVNGAKSFIESKINGDECFVSTYVSAKDFTLPLLILRAKTLTSSRASNINLKIRISKKATSVGFAQIVSRISEVMQDPSILPPAQEPLNPGYV